MDTLIPEAPQVFSHPLAALVPAQGQAPDWARCLETVPALTALASTPQDPEFHAEGDVWTHTQMVVEAVLAMPTWAALSARDRFVLFWAALLHDIAKPATTTLDPDTGRIRQPGHSARGAVDARVWLWRAGVPFAEREAICRLIAVHQVPFFAFRDNWAGHTPEFLVRQLSQHLDLRLLTALAEADMRGRRCLDTREQRGVIDDIELLRELAREEGCFGQPRRFADAFTRLRYCRGEAVDPDSVYHRLPGSEVIVMSGLPASGKNHWVSQHAGDREVVSFDDARAALGLAHGKGDGQAVHYAVDKAKDLLRRQAPFVWNATHLSRQMRAKTLDLLLAYQAQVTVVYVEQPEAVLLRRNRDRDTTLTNAALLGMLHRWDVVLPTEAHAVRYEV